MGELAILSYHGWEIDPARLVADVTQLRRDGWHDCSLADVQAFVTGARAVDRNSFHVTFDDGAEQDVACVDALRDLSCACTLFVSLDTMSDAAVQAYRGLLPRADHAGVAIGDHSLRHKRMFHSRHVIGFHSPQQPLMTSPERLGLQTGDIVCTYGGELARPRFMPDPRANELCRQAVGGISAAPGSAAWSDALAAALTTAGLASRRLGRLCVNGRYETREEFRSRIVPYLLEGRDRLAGFLGRAPFAFAHPWWAPSPVADRQLRTIGYAMTFSDQGLWSEGAYGIPRIFVSNDTVRPLVLEQIDTVARARASWALVRELGRRVLWA